MSEPSGAVIPSQNNPQGKRHFLWAGLYFVLLTILMTWPLALRMGSSFVGQIGDNLYFVWLIEWIRKAVFELHVSPVTVPFLNYPDGWSLAYTEITPAMILIALPASLLAGPFFGYNFALLSTFVLSGIGMYVWIHHLTGNKGAALVAGTIFAFLPYRMAHFLIGHLNLSGTQWFPFYFMGLYDLLRQPLTRARVGAWKPVLLAGISLGLIALTSQYYLYMTVLVSAVFILIYLLRTEHRAAWVRTVWKPFAGFGAVALPLVLVSVLPFLQLSQTGDMPDRTISYVRMYSASPTDFILPSTDHFLWGRLIGTHFDRSMWVEGTLYLGVVALALATLAWWKRRENPHRALIALLCGVSVVAFILALGTDFHWLGQAVEVQVPGFLQRWIHRESMPVPLPGYLMFRYFPYFAKMRALMRFGLFVLLPVTVLAGLGAAWLLQRVRVRWQAPLTVLLLLLVFVDFYPGPYQAFVTIQPRPVDAWLAAQPGQGAVAQFPFSQEADQEQTYYTLFHQKPFIGGFFAAFPPAQYTRIQPVLDHFPDPASVALLRQLGVEYVLVDRSAYPDFAQVEKEIGRLGLRPLTTQANEVVYGLP